MYIGFQGERDVYWDKYCTKTVDFNCNHKLYNLTFSEEKKNSIGFIRVKGKRLYWILANTNVETKWNTLYTTMKYICNGMACKHQKICVLVLNQYYVWLIVWFKMLNLLKILYQYLSIHHQIIVLVLTTKYTFLNSRQGCPQGLSEMGGYFQEITYCIVA